MADAYPRVPYASLAPYDLQLNQIMQFPVQKDLMLRFGTAIQTLYATLGLDPAQGYPNVGDAIAAALVGGGGSAGRPQLVMRPGEPGGSHDDIFVDFNLLWDAYEASVAVGVAPTVFFDGRLVSPSPITIPPRNNVPGTPYVVHPNSVLSGLISGTGGGAGVVLSDGVVLQGNLIQITDELRFISVSTQPIFVLPDNGTLLFFLMSKGARLRADGPAPFVRSSADLAGGGGATAFILFVDAGLETGVSPVFEDVAVTTGAAFVAYYDRGTIAQNTFSFTSASPLALVQVNNPAAILQGGAAACGLPTTIVWETLADPWYKRQSLQGSNFTASAVGIWPYIGGTVTNIALPPANSLSPGQSIILKRKDVGAAVLSVDPGGAGPDTIDTVVGSLVVATPTGFEVFEFVTDGISDWDVLRRP